ncbi:hypothetical protein C3L33_08739, partial [Rhododendron williamsianum]
MTRSSLKQQREQKGDEKPQQQKKRKNNNPFVFPEKKIPAVDKTPYIFRTPIDLITGSRTVRYFTPEEREAYEKKLKETEGFDVGKYPLEVMLSKPIREISLKIPTESVEFSTEAAKMALRGYNRKELTTYRFIKLVRLCKSSCGCRDAMYYITFQAKKDGKAYSPPILPVLGLNNDERLTSL